ncbi:transmembrane protein, putative (macronuclear) [Tetrahymena thermophila SB210]|uniref:Transmembrane protein, putative n=1 Tax=Tetrahymena thermophila (strain SB210) TaxID=312017 RepID=W7XKH5_TETTS|nr:transmembrane protein, putative [Tetrahymena thermophila SB210]EWS76536.1 transmembrane protein, putative [Tetrahymena thermophila SB210]|eukprot:XP_012650908.1 transmembrane protein, putative [Tetrahymena thermophila SB210]
MVLRQNQQKQYKIFANLFFLLYQFSFLYNQYIYQKILFKKINDKKKINLFQGRKTSQFYTFVSHQTCFDVFPISQNLRFIQCFSIMYQSLNFINLLQSKLILYRKLKKFSLGFTKLSQFIIIYNIFKFEQY